MINLLVKIEQDYGLPVAISLAKQAIEQNLLRTETLRRNSRNLYYDKITCLVSNKRRT